MKVGIVGAGAVGATAAFAVVMSGSAGEVVLVDLNEKLAAAQAQDIAHAIPFAHPVPIHSGTYADLAGSSVVVLAAGVGQKPDETRLQLLERNAKVFDAIIGKTLAAAPDAVLIVASNPVDAMTQLATKISGLPRGRVIGTGTMLDTARFRFLLGERLGLASRTVQSHVVGEHGDSEVLLWSAAHVGGLPVLDVARRLGRPLTDEDKARIDEDVRRAAYRIIEGKGHTAFGIGAGVSRMLGAINRDERVLICCSIVNDDVFGVPKVALSLPRVVGRAGVIDTIIPEMAVDEMNALRKSAEVLKAAIDPVESALG